MRREDGETLLRGQAVPVGCDAGVEPVVRTHVPGDDAQGRGQAASGLEVPVLLGVDQGQTVQQEFRRFLSKKADYSKQYRILALEFL